MKYYWEDTITECFEDEIWKGINGIEEYYEVSTFGRIKSLRRNIIMKQRNRGGYKSAKLSVNGVAKHKNTHQYVAETFIPNPENKPQVNHIDTDKFNTHISNLEWNTAKENTDHAYANNLIPIHKGEDCYISKFTNKEVVYIYTNPDNLTMKHLSKKFNRDVRIIHNIWNRKEWKSVTENLKLNKVLEKQTMKELDVKFIYENPYNFSSYELEYIFNLSNGMINLIYRDVIYVKFTENLIKNKIKLKKFNSVYKVKHYNEIYYVISINRFIKEHEIGRMKFKTLLKNGKEYNGYSITEISKDKYLKYVKQKYNEYVTQQPTM